MTTALTPPADLKAFPASFFAAPRKNLGAIAKMGANFAATIAIGFGVAVGATAMKADNRIQHTAKAANLGPVGMNATPKPRAGLGQDFV